MLCKFIAVLIESWIFEYDATLALERDPLMCGIAGFVGSLFFRQGEASLDTLVHRGPDGSGSWYDAEAGVWLGHRRLAIIDLEGGKQPLSNPDGTLCITFNGCIYNYVELRQELTAKGYCFQTQTDTEAILYAYAEYGEDCPSHLNGMFAFALWDHRKKQLFCARDRLGQKPFYYGRTGDTFCFASEIKGLLAMDCFERTPDVLALQEYLTFQMLLDDKTLFQDIYKLLPGHSLIYRPSDQSIKTRKYWDLDYLWVEDRPESYFVEQLQSLLEETIQSQMQSDVPIGTYLSGGLDSSVITCLMEKLNPSTTPIHSFTGAFKEGRQYDESPYARAVSDHAGTQYHETILTASDFIPSLQRIIYYMDEPAAGPGIFPQYHVAREASKHVKVILGGQGGDEIFSGYARYQLCQLEECLHALITGKGDKTQPLATMAAIAPNLSMLEQYVPMLQNFWKEGLFDSQEKRYYRLMNRSEDFKGLLHPDFLTAETHIFDKFSALFYSTNATTFLERIQHFDLKTHLQSLCQVDDRTNMAWGLESRSPLMNHRILELIAQTPPAIKFKTGTTKHLLREASKDLLPPIVSQRKDKMGFPVPLTPWMQQGLQKDLLAILLDPGSAIRSFINPQTLEKHLSQDQPFTRSLWGLLNLELWFQTFITTPSASHPTHRPHL
jgi:asparagine synthase (glutamine-hydrolysing)